MGKLTKFISADGSTTFQFTIANGVYQEPMSSNFGNRIRSTSRMVMTSGGYDNYGKTTTPSESGTLRIQGKLRVYSVNSMEDKRELLAAIQGYGLGTLYYQETDSAQDVKFCFARCTSVEIPQRADQLTDLVQPFTATFDVPYPIWHTDGTRTSVWGEWIWGTGTWGGTPETTAASGTSTDDTITYNGTAPALVKITIVCSASQTCQNPIVKRIVSGQTVDRITYTGTLGNNDELVISPEARSVKLNTVSKLENFDFLHPAWFRLVNGTNTIRVQFDNGGDAATVRYDYYENFYGA